MSGLLDAALAYARRGIPVFPCDMLGADKGDEFTDKSPLTPHGFKDASVDEAQITAWWTAYPDAGIAVATGAAGFLVVDVDSYNGGDSSLENLTNGRGPIMAPRIATGGGGWHYYFRGDERFSQGAGHVKGIDFRGTTGYVIAPPSLHRSGKRYEGIVPSRDEVPLIPEWLADAILVKKGGAVEIKQTDFEQVEVTDSWLATLTPKVTKIVQRWEKETTDQSSDAHAVASELLSRGDDANLVYSLLVVLYEKHPNASKRSRAAELAGRALRSALSKPDVARMREAYLNAPKAKVKLEVPEVKSELADIERNTIPRRVGPKMYRASELYETFKNTKLPWVAQDLLLKGEVTLVVGSAKIGKSTLLLQLLQRVTTGDPWAFSKKAMKVRHPAIYYSLEMGEVPLTRRMEQLFGRTFPDNLWVVPARDYTIDWDEIGEKVDAAGASVVVIDNLLGTNLGDINKQEVAAKVMNEAFAFAQEKCVAVVIVHHTRKGPRIQEGQEQPGDPLDEAHGSKVFANKAGILIFLRKATGKGGQKYSYCEISVVSRFGESKTIKATFDKTQKGMWRRRSREDRNDEDEEAELEGKEDEEADGKTSVVPVPSTNHDFNDSTHRTPESSEVRSTGTNLASTNHWDETPTDSSLASVRKSAVYVEKSLRVPRSSSDGIRNMVRLIRMGKSDGMPGPLWAPLRDAVSAGLTDAEIVTMFTEAP